MMMMMMMIIIIIIIIITMHMSLCLRLLHEMAFDNLNSCIFTRVNDVLDVCLQVL